MFDELFEKVRKQPKEEYVNIDLNTPEFSISTLRQRLANINSVSEKELYEVMKNNYRVILSDIFIDKKPDNLNLLVNPKFLSVLIQVLNTVEISYEDRLCCNKIVYDYLTVGVDNLVGINKKDKEYIDQLMNTLSLTVNRDILPILKGYQIPEDIANKLVMSRYSSNKEDINVKRLNFVIMSSPIEIMTEQKIVYIYETLFTNMTILFENVMFDNCDVFTSKEQEEIYSTITLALFDILNEQPINNIMIVINNYVNDFTLSYVPVKPRCSLHGLSNDYARINSVVQYLTQMNNVYIP